MQHNGLYDSHHTKTSKDRGLYGKISQDDLPEVQELKEVGTVYRHILCISTCFPLLHPALFGCVSMCFLFSINQMIYDIPDMLLMSWVFASHEAPLNFQKRISPLTRTTTQNATLEAEVSLQSN